MRRLLWLAACLACAAMVSGCEDDEAARARRAALLEIQNTSGPCVETAVLIATTAGSPNSSICPHRLHRIDVASTTLAGAEIGAVVTCRCARTDGGAR